MEFSKLKNEKEKIKVENSNLKNRLDNIIKSTVSLVDNGIITCQKYSDIKQADVRLWYYKRDNAPIRFYVFNKIMNVFNKMLGIRKTGNK